MLSKIRSRQEYIGLSLRSLSKELEVSPTLLSLVLNGKCELSKPMWKKLSYTTRVSGSPKLIVIRAEIFDPVLSILPAANAEVALNIANFVDYDLSAEIYTKDLN